jgi:hypothetical protein
MSVQTPRRRPSPHTPSSASEAAPKLTIQGRSADGSLNLKVTVPGVHGSYTLSRGPNLRPFQFEGELIAEAEKDAIDRNGRRNERGPVSHRAAIYRTRKGTFVTEFSTLDHTGARTGKADVFSNLDEACDWFRPGPLTTELLKRLGRWEPEVIE